MNPHGRKHGEQSRQNGPRELTSHRSCPPSGWRTAEAIQAWLHAWLILNRCCGAWSQARCTGLTKQRTHPPAPACSCSQSLTRPLPTTSKRARRCASASEIFCVVGARFEAGEALREAAPNQQLEDEVGRPSGNQRGQGRSVPERPLRSPLDSDGRRSSAFGSLCHWSLAYASQSGLSD